MKRLDGVGNNTTLLMSIETFINLFVFFRSFSISWQVINDPQTLHQFGVYHTNLQRSAPPNNITDRGICAFGQARSNPQANVVWIRAEARSPDTLLERLVVRGYRSITDTALLHLVDCSPNLVYLDVSGTSVTSQGVRNFSAVKPNCLVVTSLKDEPVADVVREEHRE